MSVLPHTRPSAQGQFITQAHNLETTLKNTNIILTLTFTDGNWPFDYSSQEHFSSAGNSPSLFPSRPASPRLASSPAAPASRKVSYLSADEQEYFNQGRSW